MKHFAKLLFATLTLLLLAGCSTTRKAAHVTTYDETIKATGLTDRQSDQHTGKEATLEDFIKENTNVVIEFTRWEYDTAAEPTPEAPDSTAGQPEQGSRDREGREKPPNVKSVTKGKITINGDREQRTSAKETEQTDTQEKESTVEDTEAAKKTTDEATEEKKSPRADVTLWLILIIVVLILVIVLLYYAKKK